MSSTARKSTVPTMSIVPTNEDDIPDWELPLHEQWGITSKLLSESLAERARIEPLYRINHKLNTDHSLDEKVKGYEKDLLRLDTTIKDLQSERKTIIRQMKKSGYVFAPDYNTVTLPTP